MNLIQENALNNTQKRKTYILARGHAPLSSCLFLLCMFVLLSCDNEPKITTFAQKPQNLVNQDKMKILLTEIHLAEAQVDVFKRMNTLHQDTARAVFNEFQKKIFLKNKIDSLDFDKSYEYYVRSLQMDSIYKQVTDTLKIITKKKTFGHEILPKPRKKEVQPLDSNQKNKKISPWELS